MTVIRKLVCFIFLYGSFAYSAQTDIQSKEYIVLPQIAGVAAGFLAYVLTEYPVLLTHETGHALGSYITNGQFRVEVWSNISCGIYFLIMPFQGKASDNGSFTNLIGGPIAGMLSCWLMLIAGDMAKSKLLSNKRIQHGFYKGLCEPWTTYQSIKKKVQNYNIKKRKPIKSLFWKTFFTTFFVLRVGRMVGEFLNGFTPIGFNQGQDGVRLWQYVGVPPIIIPLTLFAALCGTPIFLPIITGMSAKLKQ